MLTASETRRVVRETKTARNASARSRRAAALATFSVRLPGAVTWRRPRSQPVRGGGHRTAYPPEYVSGRDAWRLVVGAAVRAAGWRAPPVATALAVEAQIVAAGKLDLDRVTTAVLDALQGGGAIVDDCRVWHLAAHRRRPDTGEAPHVDVVVTELDR